MSTQPSTTIAIQPTPDATIRRVTKIVPYAEGGFAVVAPYHQAREGFLAKTPVNYNQVGPYAVSFESLTAFTVEDRVKLSYHPDGFAQFSGENPGRIVSGRDPATGEPKGLGLMTQPLSDPIRTGPSFGLTAWGLDEFEDLRPGKRAEIFSEEHFYYRGCTSNTWNGWSLEVFVLPDRYWAATRKRDDTYLLSMAFDAFEAARAVLEMRVIELPGQAIFLACLVSRTRVSFPSKSGFVLRGPGQRRPDGTGHALHAIYPSHPELAENRQSLDFRPANARSKA